MSMHLYSGFSEIDFQCKLLAGVNVWVVGLCKNALQLLQLRAGERRADAPLLSLFV